jgi:hypothetical protein
MPRHTMRRDPPVRRLVLRSALWLLLALGLGPAPALAATDADQPWLAGPFASSAADLARAGALSPALGEEAAQMLFQDTRFELDVEGRITFRRHWVYRVLRAEGLRDWGVSQVRWSPWHQERPRVRARVVGADGREQLFDETSFAERPAPEGREDLVGERRILERKLPAQVGSVVEEEVTVRDRTAYFTGGTTLRHYATLYIPVRRGRLTLDVPTKLPLRYGVRLMPGIEPVKTVAHGRVNLVFDYRDYAPAAAVEVGIPGHRPRFPHIAFATGRDWAGVAEAYRRKLEAALTEPAFVAALQGVPLPAASGTREERATKLLDLVASRMGGSGLELGATPPLPQGLDRALRDGVGDGKDIAAVYVALARRTGLEARVALLNSGFGPDIELNLPGLGLFNHAVVVLPAVGGQPALWLDPSAPFARVGELPLPAQGRFALVIAAGEKEPVLTPATRPIDNRIVETRDIYFADDGLGRIVERSEHFGSADRNARQVGEGLEAGAKRTGYQAYVQSMYQASDLGEVRETPSGERGQPYALRLEALGSGLVRTAFDEARAVIPLGDLLRRLPTVFLTPDLPPRREEFIFHEPFLTRWQYVLHPPSGFVASTLPPDQELAIGPGHFRAIFKRDGDLVRGEIELDVGQRLLSPAQFDDLRRRALELSARADLVVGFRHRTQLAIEQGKIGEALAEMRAAVAAEPRRPSHQARLARLLLDLGLVAGARRHAAESVSLSPAWAAAHLVHGQTLAVDEVGREGSAWADLDGATKAFARARELEGEDPRFTAATAALEAARASRRLAVPERRDLLADDPQSPLRRLLLAHVAGDGQAAQSELHPRSRDLTGRLLLEGLLPLLASAFAQPDGAARLSPDAALDAWATRLSPRVSGAPHLGYRITFDGLGERAYVAKVDGALRLVATSVEPALLGWEALTRLEAGDLEGGYRWLDWAREEVQGRDAGDPLGAELFLAVWPPTAKDAAKEPARAHAARRAAAVLAAPLDRAGATLPLLAPPMDGSAQPALAFDMARAAQGRLTARGQALIVAADELRRRYPQSALVWRWYFAALAAGDPPALRQAIAERQQQAPRDPDALRAQALTAAQDGALADAIAAFASLHAHGQLEAEDAARWAGLTLAAGDPDACRQLAALLETLPTAENPAGRSELLAWRAALAAEFGDFPRARQLLGQAADLRPLGAPRLDDGYVIGRLAESLGLTEVARDAYQRLPSPTGQPPWTFAALARKRVQKLGG